MISFKNDYSEGALPVILEALVKTNMEQTVGYGEDEYTEAAADAIRDAIGCKDCYVRLLIGGTQTNLLTISHILRPYEAVIAANTGHISQHEAGAIEATGHKVIEIPTDGSGKLDIPTIKKAYEVHKSDPHMAQPKMVYISNPTEFGTLYSKAELKAIHDYCKENDMYLYLDGARLASALASPKNDIDITDYPKYCDVFYIGGTKCGLLFGEALVIVNPKLKEGFFCSTKQKGATLAKGRLLGIQFLELFKENRYYNVGKHSNDMAMLIKDGVQKAGFKLYIDSYTNQQFFVFPNKLLKVLDENVRYEFWTKLDDDNSVIRFATSWATDENEVKKLIEFLKTLKK